MYLISFILICSELASDALWSQGYCVAGGYMSPVNDAYKKRVCNPFKNICLFWRPMFLSNTAGDGLNYIMNQIHDYNFSLNHRTVI